MTIGLGSRARRAVLVVATSILPMLAATPAWADGGPLEVPAQQLPPAYVGQPYDAQIQVVGGTAPYHFTAISTTVGFSLSATGEITGVLLLPDSAHVDFVVTDAAGASVPETDVNFSGLLVQDPTLDQAGRSLYRPPCQVQEILGGELGYGMTPPHCF